MMGNEQRATTGVFATDEAATAKNLMSCACLGHVAPFAEAFAPAHCVNFAYHVAVTANLCELASLQMLGVNHKKQACMTCYALCSITTVLSSTAQVKPA